MPSSGSTIHTRLALSLRELARSSSVASSDSTASSGRSAASASIRKCVSALVPGGFSLVGFRIRELDAHAEQQFTRLGGQPCRQLVIGHRGALIMSMTCCASSSTD